jgi:mannose-6-phosphate isomerase-like protein (cupin superfamily)
MLGEDSGGTFSLFETVTPPQAGPPPHVHHREDESFYILEGQFEFTIGDRKIAAEPGTFLFAPRDLPHWFRNVGNTPGKLLITVHPAGLEHFFAEFSELPTDAPPDIAKMTAIGNKYGIEFVL